MGNKTIAFIPARGGSKSIRLKNIKQINGRPLIYYALDAAVFCDAIDEVFVCTDSDEIKHVVDNYGKKDKIKLVSRSQESATDTAPTEICMLEFAAAHMFDNIILIQATSPLITSDDLTRGLLRMSDYDSVLSVTMQKRFIWEESTDGNWQPVNYLPNNRPRRQDFSGFYVENGSFYITRRQSLLKSKCRISGKIGTVVMDEKSYFEIDEPHDFIIVEQLLKNATPNNNEKLKNIKALFTDCDGVLTDCGMYYTEGGDYFKRFNAKDGMGFWILKEKGFVIGIITGEGGEIVKRRAEKLGMDELHTNIYNKLEVVNEIAKRRNLSLSEIAYIGDDINDLAVLNAVGFSAAVADAMDSVKAAVDYVTTRKGGEGAVREIIDLILENHHANNIR